MPKPTKTVKEEKCDNTDDVEQECEEEEDKELKSINCTEFKKSRITFKAMKSSKEAKQLVCFPKYLFEPASATPDNLEKSSDNFIVVTKPIKMVKGGVPKYNSSYHGPDQNSAKRAYFYIPKVAEDPNSMELFNFIQELDDFMDQEINKNENKKGLLCHLTGPQGDKKVKLQKLTYVRMITTAKPGTSFDDEIEGEKKEKKEFIPWERIKVKLSTVYDENQADDADAVREINTKIYLGNNEEPEKVRSITDVEKHFMWNCTAQFALFFNKVWIKKTDDRQCSFGIKCVQIGVTEQPEFKKNNSVTKQLNKRLFASVSQSVPEKKSGNTEKVTKKVTKDDKDEDDEKDEKEEDDEEKDDENDEEEEKSEPESDNDNDNEKDKKHKGDSDDEEVEEKSEPESDNESEKKRKKNKKDDGKKKSVSDSDDEPEKEKEVKKKPSSKVAETKSKKNESSEKSSEKSKNKK